MKFTFVSLFEELIKPYFESSILARAKEKALIDLEFLNPRAYSQNAYKKVDDYKIGGGAGLLMQAQPLFDLFLEFKKQSPKAHIIFLSPAGKNFTQKDAKNLAKKEHICFVCGRYEGIDERVLETFADELFCIGDFILTGGELGALVLSDAISRNIKGVLGNATSLEEESFENELLEAPAFTKPFVFEKNAEKFYTPSAFLKGNHARIASLKYQLATCKTKFFRPDLFAKANLKEKQ